MRPFKAIAAMSPDRVIGFQNRIPWHLPEDFRWFKQLTMGHALVMGRKTFDSIGRALPGRQTFVLTREAVSLPGVSVIHSFEELGQIKVPGDIFICGGEQIYKLALPLCSDLYITLVKQQVAGDTFFPPFEEKFVLASEIEDNPRFSIRHYVRKPSI